MSKSSNALVYEENARPIYTMLLTVVVSKKAISSSSTIRSAFRKRFRHCLRTRLFSNAEAMLPQQWLLESFDYVVKPAKELLRAQEDVLMQELKTALVRVKVLYPYLFNLFNVSL